MNGSLLDPNGSALPPLGPAISPRGSQSPSPIGQMAEPLAPFGLNPPSSSLPDLVAELEGIDSGSGAVDDIPWLFLNERSAPTPVEPMATVPDLDALEPFAAAGGEDEEGNEGEEDESEHTPGDDGRGSADPADGRWRVPPADWAPEAAPTAAAADAVAERLEEVARTLRDQGSAGLLVSPAHEPLHLLIAGYALGYAAAIDEIREARKN
jgi:hypothetical protein